MCPCYTNSIIFFLVWCIVGALGFVFWWTRDFGKITKSEIKSMLGASFFGPLSWLIGYFIHRS